MNWTPISESLPPSSDEYYVTIENVHRPSSNFTARALYWSRRWEFHDDTGIIDHESYGWKIVAWMPTDDPEPWNG
jgi:hypothetical protein